MKKVFFILLFGFPGLLQAGSVPQQITYQGSLKQQGVPVNGTQTMLFNITNQDGSVQYWSSGDQTVQVMQGIFSVVLTPAGVDWQNVAPYIEISINGQLLLPRDPLTSTVYAQISNTVVDGAITAAKLAPGAVTSTGLDANTQSYLVPPGLIAIFAGDCPSGWVRFSALDNLFPMGGSSYGATGGSATHNHSIADSGIMTTNPGPNNDQWVSAQAADRHVANFDHAHTIPSHNHGGWTGTASSLPPYIQVVYCQKT